MRSNFLYHPRNPRSATPFGFANHLFTRNHVALATISPAPPRRKSSLYLEFIAPASASRISFDCPQDCASCNAVCPVSLSISASAPSSISIATTRAFPARAALIRQVSPVAASCTFRSRLQVVDESASSSALATRSGKHFSRSHTTTPAWFPSMADTSGASPSSFGAPKTSKSFSQQPVPVTRLFRPWRSPASQHSRTASCNR
mmetsp:Transcript_8467/g.20380  ORF Transcript_8467/g.20380 Transcript_8467/m.20380 type:complete len:203 (-) Transcript_8467:1313-1921(-)